MHLFCNILAVLGTYIWKTTQNGGDAMGKVPISQVDAEFNRTFDTYSESIFSFCMARLHCHADDAEDCLQETFAVFYRQLKSGVQVENPRAFLYKTASNFIKKTLHKRQRRQDYEYSISEENAQLIDHLNRTDDALLTGELQQVIEKTLTQQEKTIFALRFEQGQPVKNIAQQLGMTPGNCATQICRMRNKLRTVLQSYL